MKLKFSTIAFTFLLMLQFISMIRSQENQVGMAGAAATLYQQSDESGGKYGFVYSEFIIKTVPAKDSGSDILRLRAR